MICARATMREKWESTANTLKPAFAPGSLDAASIEQNACNWHRLPKTVALWKCSLTELFSRSLDKWAGLCERDAGQPFTYLYLVKASKLFQPFITHFRQPTPDFSNHLWLRGRSECFQKFYFTLMSEQWSPIKCSFLPSGSSLPLFFFASPNLGFPFIWKRQNTTKYSFAEEGNIKNEQFRMQTFC